MAANPNQPATARLRERLSSRLSAERAKADLERLDRLTQRGPLRVVRAAVAGYNNHNDSLWASALTYTFSLSLIPILAVALSAVKGLVGTDVIKPIIEEYLAINSPEMTDRILQYVGHINAATLGTVGGATLLVTVLLTLGTIERSFNTIFNVPQERTWIRKFTDYLSIIFTVPLLLAAAASLKGGIDMNLPRLPGLSWLVATLPVWAGFSFLYLFFPNTKVKWSAAALGGLLAAILLEIGQWGYIKFQVGAGRYQMIYGALAAVPILLTWIYIAWTVVLCGAELTAAVQGTEATFSIDYRSPAFFRTAVLLIVFRAAERAISRKAPVCTIESLSAELGAPSDVLRPIIDQLQLAGIIVEVSSDGAAASQSGIFLARDSSELTLGEVFDAFERPDDRVHGDERILSVLNTLASTIHDVTAGLTVKDLVTGRFNQTAEQH